MLFPTRLQIASRDGERDAMNDARISCSTEHGAIITYQTPVFTGFHAISRIF
jgi:hypothetical protein